MILFKLACFVDSDGKKCKLSYIWNIERDILSLSIHQYHAIQPLFLEAIREFGIDISAGQLNIILVENKES